MQPTDGPIDSHSDVDEHSIKYKLLIEQLKAAEIQNKRGWLWHMGPTLGAIAASITASLIIILVGNQLVERIIDNYYKRVTTAKEEIKALTDSLTQIYEDVNNLKSQKAELTGNIVAFNDTRENRNNENNIGISIEIKEERTCYYLNVYTYPEGVKIFALTDCKNNFVFPDKIPIIDSCSQYCDVVSLDGQLLKSQIDSKTGHSPCKIGPIGKNGNCDNSVWVIAELNGKRTCKIIQLSGQ
ncbi:MAG TPA: hypothetical protein DEO84_05515 [candidate division Zixibacteria bacterium]|jgi:hypothetical protein|nr:hypothetical protein [candidate division Zixibacteria bacterium]